MRFPFPLGVNPMSSEVSANLDSFINKGLPDAMRLAMMQAVSTVQQAAQMKAPSDTGNLKRSIEIDVEEDGTQGIVYSNCEYAPYVEIGTGIHSAKGTGRKKPWRYHGSHGWVTTSGNPAQPFLEPAVDENQSQIIKFFEGLI